MKQTMISIIIIIFCFQVVFGAKKADFLLQYEKEESKQLS